jgi:hypothetical protein
MTTLLFAIALISLFVFAFAMFIRGVSKVYQRKDDGTNMSYILNDTNGTNQSAKIYPIPRNIA